MSIGFATEEEYLDALKEVSDFMDDNSESELSEEDFEELIQRIMAHEEEDIPEFYEDE